MRKIILDAAKLKPGATAIEIGCGTGALLCDLAQTVGQSGRVFGLEPQKVFAQEARKRLAAANFSSVAEVREESAENLSIEDFVADACVAQTVLIHLPDAVLRKALTEMTRVIKIGGRVVSCDQDGDTWTIDHPDRELTRRIVRFNSDQRYADGWTGRRLRRFFREAGLENVEVKTLVHADTEKSSYLFGMAERMASAAAEIKIISLKEQREWLKALHGTADGGNFFSSINYFICAGTRRV
jgi:ubiquinone/menaquinone biosynthesis C-methylase UbiE